MLDADDSSSDSMGSKDVAISEDTLHESKWGKDRLEKGERLNKEDSDSYPIKRPRSETTYDSFTDHPS